MIKGMAIEVWFNGTQVIRGTVVNDTRREIAIRNELGEAWVSKRALLQRPSYGYNAYVASEWWQPTDAAVSIAVSEVRS